MMDAKTIIARYDTLRAERRWYERAWEEEAQLFDPGRRGMTHEHTNRDKRQQGVYSSDPMIAANALRSGLYGTLANQASPWFSLGIPDLDLMDHKPVRLWLDATTKIVQASFGTAVSAFYPTTVKALRDTTIYGNAASYDELNVNKKRIMDLTIPLGEIVVARDAFDELVEVIRKFQMTAQAIRKRWPEAPLPKAVKDAIEGGKNTKFWVYHYVAENDDWRPGYLGTKGKKVMSIHALEEGETRINAGGFEEMPFTYPGWDRDAGETYARGAAYIATPAARVLNLMEAANLEAGERAARPAILAPDRRALRFNMKVNPGSVLYGAMQGGRPQIAEFSPTRGTGLSLEMAQQKTEQIKDAFFWSLMQMAGRSGMSATEVMEKQAEKLVMMAPHLGNIQTEFLGPKVARRFAMLYRAGQIAPPPEELADQPLAVEYQSAAALASRHAEGAAMTRFIQDLTPLMDRDPRYADRLDPDGVTEILQAARGVPARGLRSREEADAKAQARAEQEEAAQGMAAMQQMTGMAKDLSGMMPENALPA